MDGKRLRAGGWRAGALWAPVALGLAGLIGFAGAATGARPQAERSTVGKRVTEFRLKDNSGKLRSLSEFKDSKALVLVFIGAGCPISNSYAEPLSQLAGRYRAQGVQFLGINANLGEDLAAVTKHAAEYRIGFPVLKDERQALADQVGARVTPEVFVLDRSKVVRYQGRIDDSYESRTRKRNQVTSRDLQAALDAVLAGKPVPQPVTQALGCAIARPEKAALSAGAVTFHKSVEPILQERCQTCHRPGQLGPFSLLTYADAKSWANEIKQFTTSRQMPPWKAEPGHGEFLDVRRLTDAEVQTIAQWVDAGSPEGSLKDAPPAKEWKDDWMLGKPDLVVSTEPFHVEATGDDIFQCFVMPTGLTEDRQVVGVEIRPGNPRVAHHVLNFLDNTGKGRELDAKDPGPGYRSGAGGPGFLPTGGLGGWAPGNLPRYLPKGVGLPLPKGTDLVIQMHYHKTGKPETDQTRVGIYFAKEPIERPLRTLPVTNVTFQIPPGVARHEVRASWPVLTDMHALQITPHMHLLGKEMKVTAKLPDGTEKDLIWVKDWDYRWQDTYRYKEPVALPRGSRIDMVAYFDNTSGNPLNPHNPPKPVTFGEQTTDEMCFAFVGFTRDVEPPAGTGNFRFFDRN